MILLNIRIRTQNKLNEKRTLKYIYISINIASQNNIFFFCHFHVKKKEINMKGES